MPPGDYDVSDRGQAREDRAIVCDPAQGRNAAQVVSGAGQATGLRATGEQQARVRYFLAALQVDEVLPCVESDDSVRQAADLSLLVKGEWACPQVPLAHAPCQIAFEGRAIVDREGIAGDDNNGDLG